MWMRKATEQQQRLQAEEEEVRRAVECDALFAHGWSG